MSINTRKKGQTKINDKNGNNENHKDIKVVRDKINLNIIKELMENPNIKSSELAEKLQIPLSTIQRRRATLEKSSILKKEYSIDLRNFGLRIAEILIDIEKGDYNEILDDIKDKYNKHIISISRKIGDPGINIGIKVIYSDSLQLFEILEELRKSKLVKRFDWYESILEDKIQRTSFIDILDKY